MDVPSRRRSSPGTKPCVGIAPGAIQARQLSTTLVLNFTKASAHDDELHVHDESRHFPSKCAVEDGLSHCGATCGLSYTYGSLHLCRTK
jgi:hypothetical protein